MTSAKVPCRAGSCDHDRGNNSYQVEKRARSLSTTISNRRDRGLRAVGVGVHVGSELREKASSRRSVNSRLRSPSVVACFLSSRGGLAPRPEPMPRPPDPTR